MNTKRFTVRLYSDFGMCPQDQTRILFESDDLVEIKDYIREYFEREDYFNAVYFVDNELNKSDYVGRDLTIGCGESLFSFCGESEPKSIDILENNCEQTNENIAMLLNLSYDDAESFYSVLSRV